MIIRIETPHFPIFKASMVLPLIQKSSYSFHSCSRYDHCCKIAYGIFKLSCNDNQTRSTTTQLREQPDYCSHAPITSMHPRSLALGVVVSQLLINGVRYSFLVAADSKPIAGSMLLSLKPSLEMAELSAVHNRQSRRTTSCKYLFKRSFNDAING